MRFSTLHIQYYIIANYFSYIVVISDIFYINAKNAYGEYLYIMFNVLVLPLARLKPNKLLI